MSEMTFEKAWSKVFSLVEKHGNETDARALIRIGAEVSRGRFQARMAGLGPPQMGENWLVKPE